MVTSPLQVIGIWLRGLLALALIGGSIYLWREWHQQSQKPAETRVAPDGRLIISPDTHFDYDFGMNRQTALLASAAGLSLWCLGGGMMLSRMRRPRRTADRHERRLAHTRRGTAYRVARPGGRELHVETDGPADAPPIIFIHGVGADGACFNPHREPLARHRLIRMDLPGHGLSDRIEDGDYSLPRLADDLKAVIEFAYSQPLPLDTDAAARRDREPAVLVGHSLGGMIILQLCQQHPDFVRERVAGIVLTHTTYTNPLRTMSKAKLYTALQKPVIEPLCYAAIPASPVLWLLGCLGYLNGSVHRSNHRNGFSGHESREQLDFIARYTLQDSPAVLARAALGMFRYDATSVLPKITVPTLVVGAKRDPETSFEASQRMHADIPGSALMVLPDAKHYGAIEYNHLFADEITRFADACQGTSPAAAPRPPRTRQPGADDGDFTTKTTPEVTTTPSHEKRLNV